MKYIPLKFSLMLCLVSASNLIAQDLTTFVETDAAIPSYDAPYSILGAQPGMNPDETLELLQDHFDQELTFEEGVLNTSNAAGARIQYAVRPRLGTFWITPNIKLNGEPYEQLYVNLGTGVVGERALSLSRTINDDSGTLPSPQDLQVQIEAEYGSPSFVDIGPVSLEMLYAWDGDGLISDLRAQSRALYDAQGTKGPDARYSKLTNLHHRTTCKNATEYAIGYGNRSFPYTNQQNTDELGEFADPKCRLHFLITLSSDQIDFSLKFHELNTFNNTKTDKQIDDNLDNNNTAPSDLIL